MLYSSQSLRIGLLVWNGYYLFIIVSVKRITTLKKWWITSGTITQMMVGLKKLKTCHSNKKPVVPIATIKQQTLKQPHNICGSNILRLIEVSNWNSNFFSMVRTAFHIVRPRYFLDFCIYRSLLFRQSFRKLLCVKLVITLNGFSNS